MGPTIYKSIKRILDLALAMLAIVLLAPIFAAVAVAIKLESRGPVFYRQVRVGQNGREFSRLSFRTMFVEPHEELHRLYIEKLVAGELGPERGAPLFKLANDPRVSRVGRFLRRTSLEELPQILNVLKGDMALVGPRAALPYEVDHYEQWQRRRLGGKPGMTGVWQVGSGDVDFDEMTRMDIDYLERQSLTLDLSIVLRTVPAAFRTARR